MPANAAASARRSCVIFIEQNFGPHIEQKCASLALSLGRVSSWNFRAVSGSSDRLNWSRQRKSKRGALESYQRFLELSGGKYPNQEFQARQRIHIIQLELKKG